MKFLQPGIDVKKLDASAKNKWRWQWMSEKDKMGRPFSRWCQKIDGAGLAFCELCNKTLNYGSNGKRALQKHSDDADHLKAFRAQMLTQTLSGACIAMFLMYFHIVEHLQK